MIVDEKELDWIDRGCNVHYTAKIYPGVEMEDNVYIGPHCIIGAPAEINRDWSQRPCGRVIIRKGAVLTGLVTVDSGSEGVTEIGENCFLMKQTHIGHDAVLGNNVTLSPGARVGGECVLGDWVNVGMNAVIHQQTEIPEKCMLGMCAVITKKAAAHMLACETWAGNPAQRLGKNKKWI